MQCEREQEKGADWQGPGLCVRDSASLAYAPCGEGAGKEKLPHWRRTRLSIPPRLHICEGTDDRRTR